jgi:DNA helicase-2/ATP-dependent DNA helicase PcrA
MTGSSDHPTQPTGNEPLLEGLTEPQRLAVMHERGPCLVLAAAGSGKTRVITRRIARLISRGVPPWSILALTFTNKAAGEMRERVHAIIGEHWGHDPRFMRGLTVTTFHSLCARLLRRHADAAGLKPDFTIYDSGDQSSLCKKVIEALQLSTSNWPPRTALSAISAAKNELIDVEGYKASAADFYTKTLAKIYAGYQESLRRANAVDFDDLLVLTARTLRHSEQVRDECQRRWNHLLIDEYQDTNRAQFVIASLLAGDSDRSGAWGRPRPVEGSTGAAFDEPRPQAASGGMVRAPLPGMEDEEEAVAAPASPPPTPEKAAGRGSAAAGSSRSGAQPPGVVPGPNIFVVGDPDQAIYGWRGADISNILDFESHYPSARVIPLGENFRSTAPILAIADTLIRHNERRKHKDLFTRRPGGENVQIVLTREEQHEAQLVVEWISSLHHASEEAAEGPGSGDGASGSQGFAWRDMAVFYRTNALSRVLEDAFRAAGVPYVIARGTAFYDREEIKNALSYLRVIANPADDVSLGRIVNVPARGLGDASLTQLENHAAAAGIPLLGALRDAREVSARGNGSVSPRALNAAERFVQLMDGWTGGGTFMGADVSGSLADLVARVIKESGLEGMYKKQAAAGGQNDGDEARLENLDELISSARQFELEFDAAADPAQDREEDGSPAADVPPLLAMLRAYLESVALVADADEVDPAQGAVTLMTLHAAKGLEFKAAAIVGLEEGMLPHARALAAPSDMEEERRLCFVGITRAMRRLLMSCAAYRTFRGMPERTIPSRFLEEIGREHVTVIDRANLMEGFAEDDRGDDAAGYGAAGRGGYGAARPSYGSPGRGPGGGYGGRGGGGPGAGYGRPSGPAPGSTGDGAPADGPRFVPDESQQLRRAAGGGGGRGGAGGIAPGNVVRHPQFGEGVVVTVTAGPSARAKIRFRSVGEKTLVLEYARLTRVG